MTKLPQTLSCFGIVISQFVVQLKSQNLYNILLKILFNFIPSGLRAIK